MLHISASVIDEAIAAGGDNFTVLTGASDPIGGPVDLDAPIDSIERRP